MMPAPLKKTDHSGLYQPFESLRFPREIHDMIYDCCLEDTQEELKDHGRVVHLGTLTSIYEKWETEPLLLKFGALLNICRQITLEFIPKFYAALSFRMTISCCMHWEPGMKPWAHLRTLQTSGLTTHLYKRRIHRHCGPDILGALEECILLEHLEFINFEDHQGTWDARSFREYFD